jgi:prolipoprotein diacylglyceryltransferase
MEFTLLYAALAGVLPLWVVASRTAASGGRTGATSQGGRELADAALGAAVVGLFAGRLVAMIDVGVNPLTAPADIIIVRGGVSTAGASIAALLFSTWTVRKLEGTETRAGQRSQTGSASWRQWIGRLGVLAPAALAGLAGWHAGCVFRDACLGSPAPWGRHPTELYAAVLFTLGAIGVARIRRRLPERTADLAAVGAAVAIAGLVRLGTEFVRPSLTGGPKPFYAVGAILGLVVIALAVRLTGVRPPDEPEDGGDAALE